jgi:hypothetical protein
LTVRVGFMPRHSRSKRYTAGPPIWVKTYGGKSGEKTQGFTFQPGDPHAQDLLASIAVALASGRPWDLTLFKVHTKRKGSDKGKQKLTVTIVGEPADKHLRRWIHSRE